jgi:hypothetical protein
MLTNEDLEILKKPFQPRFHRFHRGFAYVKEDAICERIEMIDPAWELQWQATDFRDGRAIVTVALTVAGVTRCGVGMADVVTKTRTDKDTGEVNEYEVTEPEKAAATDAFKRAARLFGIGRYLLNLPQGIDNENALRKWLIANYAPDQVGSDTQQQPSPPPPTESREDTTEGETMDIEIAEVEVCEAKNGNLYLRVHTTTDERASVFTRAIFKDAGYIDDDSGDWQTVGERVGFEPPVAGTFIRNKRGYWDLHTITEYSLWETGMKGRMVPLTEDAGSPDEIPF